MYDTRFFDNDGKDIIGEGEGQVVAFFAVTRTYTQRRLTTAGNRYRRINLLDIFIGQDVLGAVVRLKMAVNTTNPGGGTFERTVHLSARTYEAELHDGVSQTEYQNRYADHGQRIFPRDTCQDPEITMAEMMSVR